MDTAESVQPLLESIAEDGYEAADPQEMLEDFVARTPYLTPGERADILAMALDSAEFNAFNTGRDIQGYGQLAGSLLNFGAGIAGMFGGRDARRAQQVLSGLGAGTTALTGLVGGGMQAFGRPPTQRPGTPPTTRPGTRPGTPQQQRLQQQRLQQQRLQQQRLQQQRMQQQRGPQQGSPLAGITGLLGSPQMQQLAGGLGGQGGANMMGMLQQMMSNPQLMAALSRATVGGSNNRREVVLEVPDAEGGTRAVAIPLGAVMNTVATLATGARNELNAATHESDPEVPEYLVGEDGEFIVDPANPEQRAELVLQYFRAAREAERAGLAGGGDEQSDWGLMAFEDDDDEDFEDDDDEDFEDDDDEAFEDDDDEDFEDDDDEDDDDY